MARLLAKGSVGPDVATLQGMLNFHLTLPRRLLVRDGVFGPRTEARVIEFQRVNNLIVDGIVGPQTTSALLAVVSMNVTTIVSPSSLLPSLPSPPPVPNFQLKFPSVFPPPLGNFRLGPPLPLPPPIIPVSSWSATLLVGQQFSVQPWVFSPIVITGQINNVIRNPGRPPFTSSFGGQFAVNQLGSPSGRFTGQAFAQFGVGGGVIFGPLDLFNPFVIAFSQKNDGQPLQAGLGVGNQAQINLLGDRLFIFLNTQAVSTIDLSNGRVAAPAGQATLGIGWTGIFF